MAVTLIAAAPLFPDRQGRGVVDAADVLPEAAERALNDKVVAYEKASHHQLAVATVPSLQGYDIKDYGYQMFRKWGLGRKDKNDGVLLLLAPSERKVRIEVGYGLESSLTDGTTMLIIKDAVVPQLKAGDIPAALNAGVDGIIANAAADESAAPAPTKRESNGLLWLLLGGLGVVGAGGVTLWSLARGRRRREEEARERAEEERRRERVRERYRESTAKFKNEAPARYVKPIRKAPERQRERDVYVPSPTPSPSPSSSDSSSSWGSYDSGGGSCGGGGSDSSY
jgi:uncharacterized membrane protein YgcG